MLFVSVFVRPVELAQLEEDESQPETDVRG